MWVTQALSKMPVPVAADALRKSLRDIFLVFLVLISFAPFINDLGVYLETPSFFQA
jgi:hypothetical protein